MSELDPQFVFDLLAHDVPAGLHGNLLVVGSLAAAQHHRDRLRRHAVNTKDADIVVQPAGAFSECVAIARKLREANWSQVPDERFEPQPTPDDVARMPVVRLRPPDSTSYFIELLGFPETAQREIKRDVAIELDDGWYCLPCFKYLGLARVGARRAPNGLAYAEPRMLALANLLHHPRVGTDRMSGLVQGRRLLRSAKDLGRVLALARLGREEELGGWATTWSHALLACFPEEHAELARRAGAGLRELLADADAMEEAWVLVSEGLLAGYGVTIDQLRAIGRQVLSEAIQPLEQLAAHRG